MVVLDTFGDRRNGFFFAVNPRGARAEGQIANNSESLNFDWDGIWDAAARVDGEGWTAELAIPFKTLRFRKDLAAWGLNVQRYVARRQETDRWTAARRDVWISNLSEAGRLEGLSTARGRAGASTSGPTSRGDETNGEGEVEGRRRRLQEPDAEPHRLAHRQHRLRGDGGGRPPGEPDALSRSSTRRSARSSSRGPGSTRWRASAAATPTSLPFYSRRIGLYRGEEVPILAGLKVSGRVDRWNVGFLDVETGRKDELGLDRQNLLAARVSRNLFRQSFVGAFVTHGNPSGAGEQHAGRRRRALRHVHLPGRGEPEPRPLRASSRTTRRRGARATPGAASSTTRTTSGTWPSASRRSTPTSAPPSASSAAPGSARRTRRRTSCRAPAALGIRQLFFEASGQYVSDIERAHPRLDGRSPSPLGFQTESGERAPARVGPAVRAARRAVRDPGRDRHPRRRLPLHRVDRRGGDGPAAAVGGGGRGALGELLRRGPHAARGRARAQAEPAPARRRRGRVEPGRAARRALHGEGPRRAARAELHPEPGLVEPRAVRLGLAGARLPEPAALAGAARAATSSSSSTGAGSTRRTASTARTSTAARPRSSTRSGSDARPARSAGRSLRLRRSLGSPAEGRPPAGVPSGPHDPAW